MTFKEEDTTTAEETAAAVGVLVQTKLSKYYKT
jgi:hypothetical protein